MLSKLILISNPDDLENEHVVLHQLFEAGLTHFHIRKPEYTLDEMRNYIEKIQPQYYNKVVIHSFHQFVVEYNLKGFHYGAKTMHLLSKNDGKNRHRSFSAHSLIELIDLQYKNFDYIFLSPIFNSISKKEYHSGFNLAQLMEFFAESELTTDVVALGGIKSENVALLEQVGFSGIGLLGSIWNMLVTEQNTKEIINYFNGIKAQLK